MNTLDIAILLILAGFTLGGIWSGLVKTVLSFIGSIVALFVAVRFFQPLGNWFTQITGWEDNISKIIIFIVAFLVITKLVSMVFWFAEKSLKIFTKAPIIGTLNRIGGGIFGFVEGVLMLSITAYVVVRFPLGESIMSMISESVFVPMLLYVSSLLVPLLPKALRLVQSSVDMMNN